MVSHGGQEYAYDFLTEYWNSIRSEKYSDLRLKMRNAEVAKIPGVVQFFQQDAGFAQVLLKVLWICTRKK